MQSSKVGLNNDSDSDSDSDSSATISDGSSAMTDSDTESDEEPPSPFEDGEKVLAVHNQLIYPAGVMKAESQSKEWQYYVHYNGWNKHWDDWVGLDRLMKYNEEKVPYYRARFGEKHKGRAWITYKTQRGKKRKSDSLGQRCLSVEKLVNLQIVPTLKKQLLDDCEFVTHQGKLAKLPRTSNVDDIMKKYLDYRLMKDGLISEAVREITKGFCCYFNKALPVMLLYKSEHVQYVDAIKDVSPSTVYGTEHLLRLFVARVNFVYANIEDETLMELQQRLVDFLKFLQNNQGAFFLSNYHVVQDTETSSNGRQVV